MLQKCNNTNNTCLQRYDSVSQTQWWIQCTVFQMKIACTWHISNYSVALHWQGIFNRNVLLQVCFHASNLKNTKWAHYLCCLGNINSCHWLNNNHHRKTNAKIRSLLLAVTSDVAHWPVICPLSWPHVQLRCCHDMPVIIASKIKTESIENMLHSHQLIIAASSSQRISSLVTGHFQSSSTTFSSIFFKLNVKCYSA